MRTAAQLIEDCGGAEALANAIGQSVGTVRVWKHRNAIPRTAWPEVQLKFPAIRLTTLLAAEAAKTADQDAAA